MVQLQHNSAKAEIYLKERYEKEVIFAIANKFKAKEQIIREGKFLKQTECVKKGQEILFGATL